MSLSSLSSADLKKLIQLVKEKEVLEVELAKVNAALNGLDTGSIPKEPAIKPRGPRRGRRRAKLKDRILKALHTAGESGMSVKELASNLKANPGSVSVWFYTTGKKIKGLKKIEPARYTFSA
jgi:hypothetical protein